MEFFSLMFPFEISQAAAGQELVTNVIFININEEIDNAEFDIAL